MHGLDLDDDGPAWINVVWTLALEAEAGGLSSVVELADKWRETYEWGTPNRPDRELWGTTATAEAGMKAMEALAGGAASRRPRSGES